MTVAMSTIEVRTAAVNNRSILEIRKVSAVCEFKVSRSINILLVMAFLLFQSRSQLSAMRAGREAYGFNCSSDELDLQTSFICYPPVSIHLIRILQTQTSLSDFTCAYSLSYTIVLISKYKNLQLS